MIKTILITGATDGIGLLTAQKLAGQGNRILIHGRSADKLAQAQADTGAAGGYLADLSDLGQVRALADAVLADCDRLDVLINNAGVFKTSQPRTPTGMDSRFVVNTLAPWLLTQRLLPVIPAEGRVINLSSAAQARVDVAALRGQGALDDMPAYAQSKLALTIWSAELARDLPDGPAVIAVNPGSLLASKMVRQGFGVAGSDLAIGADILCRAAFEAGFAARSGAYFDNDSGLFSDPDPAALDADHCAQVMAAIRDLV